VSLSRYDAWKLASPPEGVWCEKCEEEVDTCIHLQEAETAQEDYDEMRAEERRHGDD
jgi:hypothetical protein